MGDHSRFITDPGQIVWWSYEDSLGLKTIGTKRVYVLADGTPGENGLVPCQQLSSISESWREDIIASLVSAKTGLRITRGSVKGNLAQASEERIRSAIKAETED